jgi:peptidoglycan/xylan/chitin deacetylase (PgdA/CDA1 family)
MTWDEIREMENSKMVIGGHSHSHPMLDRIPVDKMKKEIDLSVAIMNSELKKKVDTYAYPYGTYNKDVTDYLQELDMLYSFATGNKENNLPLRRYEIYRIDESSLNID